jgi:hypothetical protein
MNGNMFASRKTVEIQDHTLNPLAYFFSTYLRRIAYATIGLLLVISAVFIFFYSSRTEEGHYLKVETAFQEFLAADTVDPHQINEIKEILGQSTYLKQKYQARFAQQLTMQEKWDDGLREADETIIKSTASQAWPFVEYSQASLLIAQKKYQEALSMSQNLDQTLSAEPEHMIIKAYNLLRIGMLFQAVGKTGEEAIAWSNFQSYLLQHKQIEKLASIQNNFRVGEITLADYIKHREALLKEEIVQSN